MELGLHISNFTFGGPNTELAPTLASVVRKAEDVGFAKVTVMDHLWQINQVGNKNMDMLEAYTTLGYLAAHTSKVELFTLVTGVTYRAPGLLAKAVTTLDVLSGGRAWLGVGAAWNEEEAIGLGLDFAPTAERFARLEEALQICQQMFSGEVAPYRGEQYQLAETLNLPLPINRPRIMVGGSGEKKTLRLVAKYADACNLFGDAKTVAHKLTVLRDHCAAVGRDYDTILRTSSIHFDVGSDGEKSGQLLENLRQLHDAGIQVVHGSTPIAGDVAALDVIGRDIIPEISRWT
ncbi:LLM class F420-dependent oxidoreductase [Amycolatopsis pithecellobii]|uniref:TIGR03560 family F420-dependent LLM class oxidoreductase n=1 Tax=Amycolatopsis pithecellobii TaxID=664692 RepID=A0A6N7Z8Q7_9PSEU|nr:LLM class F420-dependent oxidoreductase [Amycolatopsis pithecellobii]MTD58020.1 TIGR03560 family F420-dependent LLM class oxidoreductase [Amycolatopsis pithecellobii]